MSANDDAKSFWVPERADAAVEAMIQAAIEALVPALVQAALDAQIPGMVDSRLASYPDSEPGTVGAIYWNGGVLVKKVS